MNVAEQAQCRWNEVVAWWKSRNWKFEAVFFVVSIVFVLAALLPVLRIEGFPENHDRLSYAERTLIQADHVRQGDFFPLWASSTGFEFGTPLPLFYHKTFYYVSTAFYLIVPMKAAIMLATATFLLIGIYGMRRSVGWFTSKRWWVVLVSGSWVLTYYVFTTWLVRGAMAEFAAIMVVPWLIAWCLRLIKTGRATWSIGPILFLVVQGHNITGLASAGLPAIAWFVYTLQTVRRRTWRRYWEQVKHVLIAVVLFGALLAPQSLAQLEFLKYFNPDKITQDGWAATDNFQELALYFTNNEGYEWLSRWQGQSIQIDPTLLIVCAVSLGLFIASVIATRRSTSALKRRRASSLFLVLSLGLYICMQLPQCLWVYRVVTSLEYLQFPWRLLGIITPLLVVSIVALLSSLRWRSIGSIGVVCLVAGMFIANPGFRTIEYEVHSTQQTKEHLENISGYTQGGLLVGNGEYLPTVYVEDRPLEALETVLHVAAIANRYPEFPVRQNGCVLHRFAEHRPDPLRMAFIVRCEASTEIELPVTYAPFMSVTKLNGERVDVTRTDEEFRATITVEGSAESQVVIVGMPTVWSAVGIDW